MERIFTKDVGARFKSGQLFDYPKAVWDRIAINAGEPLDEITEPVTRGTPAKAMIEKRKGKVPLAQSGAT
jgi:hypothetical protein